MKIKRKEVITETIIETKLEINEICFNSNLKYSLVEGMYSCQVIKLLILVAIVSYVTLVLIL